MGGGREMSHSRKARALDGNGLRWMRPGSDTGRRPSAGLRPDQSEAVASRWVRLGALAGIAGPAAFTISWVVASLRQPGQAATAVLISGLAADNARDPWIMVAGFVLLGGCAIGFGSALRVALGDRFADRAGPSVIQAAGLLTIAAGLLRRDHTLLTSGQVSWHNHAHDVVSAVVYVLLITSLALLALRFRQDSRWQSLALPVGLVAASSAVLLVAYNLAEHAAWAGLVQRIAVTLALAAVVAVAVRLAASAWART